MGQNRFENVNMALNKELHCGFELLKEEVQKSHAAYLRRLHDSFDKSCRLDDSLCMYCSHSDGEQFIFSGKQNGQPSAISHLCTAVSTLISFEQLVLVSFSSGASNSSSLPLFSQEKGH